MPRWKTGLLGVKESGARKARSPRPPEAVMILDVVEERMPLGFVVLGMKQLKQPWALMQLGASLISKYRGRC